MLYEVITEEAKRATDEVTCRVWRLYLNVITSYSIHYTKLYEVRDRRKTKEGKGAVAPPPCCRVRNGFLSDQGLKIFPVEPRDELDVDVLRAGGLSYNFV